MKNRKNGKNRKVKFNFQKIFFKGEMKKWKIIKKLVLKENST